MKSFEDARGNRWEITVNAAALIKVEDALGVSFARPGDDDGPFMRIFYDPLFCFRVAWLLCEDAARTKSMTSEQFSDLLIGDALDGARVAVMQAIADFLPGQARREAAVKLISVLQRAEAAMIGGALDKLNAVDIEAMIGEAMDGQSA